MLPEPYHDELFYSVVARAADHMGLTNASAINQFVFGTKRLSPTIEFPPRLDLLLPRLLPGSPYGLPSLLAEHSLVPYYTAFLAEDQVRAGVEAIIQAQAVEAFNRLSINAVSNPLHLKFCECCAEADLTSGREPYWRRVHQLPGCLLCFEHGRALRNGVSIRGQELAGFVSVSRMLASGAIGPEITSRGPDWVLHGVAESSRALLFRADASSRSDMSPRFFALLQSAGWAAGRRLAATDIMRHVEERLGPDVLALLDVGHARYNPPRNPGARGRSTDWLARSLRVRGCVGHPLPYLLILLALDLDLEDLLSPTEPTRSVPAGPVVLSGPCANVLCPDHDPPVVRPLPAAPPEGVFVVDCATCGFAYRRSPKADERKHLRIARYGDLWDRRLRVECDRGEASIPELMRVLGLGIETIKRRAYELGIWHPRWGKRTFDHIRKIKDGEWTVKLQAARESYKAKWLALIESHPEVEGRRALGRFDEVAYAFLRKHEPAWLDAVTPKRRADRRGRRVAEPDRDEALVTLIDRAAHDLRGAVEPCRVTRVLIARTLGWPVLRLDPVRYPMSIAALARHAETAADFKNRLSQVRRTTAGADEDALANRLDEERR